MRIADERGCVCTATFRLLHPRVGSRQYLLALERSCIIARSAKVSGNCYSGCRHRTISNASSGEQPRATRSAISCQSTRPAKASANVRRTPRRRSCSAPLVDEEILVVVLVGDWHQRGFHCSVLQDLG